MKKLIFSFLFLCMAVCVMAAVPADGTYFLRATNVGDGNYYLGRGNSSGTQAILDPYGLAVTISTSRNITTFTFADTDKKMFRTTDAYIFTDYDSSGNQNWTITEIGSSRTYRIRNNANTATKYVYADATSPWKNLMPDGDESNCVVWEFETPAVHAEKMAALRTAAGTIPNPGTQYVRDTDIPLGLNTEVSEHRNFNPNASSYEHRLFHETITLQPGVYKLSVPALYSMRTISTNAGTSYYAHDMHTNKTDCPPVYAYIGDQKVQLHSVFDFNVEQINTHTVTLSNKYYPVTTTSALTAFQGGKYINEVWIEIDTEQTVEYGIYEIGNPQTNGHWICWSEKLTKLEKYKEAPLRDGTYFLKAASAANNLYLSRGNDYGTRTVLDYWGLPIVAETSLAGITTLKVADMNRYLHGFTDSNNCYTDLAANDPATNKTKEWVLQPNGQYFKLQSNAKPGMYLRYNPADNDEWKNLYTNGSDQQGTVIEWLFQTPAEHKAEMEALRTLQRQHSSIDGLQSFTYLTRNTPLTDATVQEHFMENGDTQSHLMADRQRLTRTTELLMPGIYKLTIPAFYRMGTVDNAYALHESDADCVPVYAFFGSKKVQIYSLYDFTVTDHTNADEKGGNFYPNGKVSAANAFNEGNYRNELWLEIETPATVDYGIFEMGHPIETQHWLCWSEQGIELVRYGDLSYHYTEPQADNRCLLPGDVATVTFDNHQEQHQQPLPVLQQDYSGVTLSGHGISKNATELGITTDGVEQGFKFSMPTGLTPGATYTLHIPSSAIRYEGDAVERADYQLEIHSRILADGTYFLKAKNVTGKAKYLSRGNTYGTRAMLDNWGLPLLVTTDNDNHTRIRFADTGANGYLYDVNGSAYTDWPQPNVGQEATWWTLSEENGDILISSNGNEEKYLRLNPAETGWKNIYSNGSNSNGTVVAWEFELPATHQGIMNQLQSDAASTVLQEEAQDASRQQMSYATYTITNETPIQEHFNVYDNGGDVWGGTTQPLRPGIYKFSMQAFYRMASNDVTYPLHTAGADCPPVYLYIGSDTVQIHSVFDYTTTDGDTYNQGGNFYPNGKTSARRAFQEGDYKNEIWFEVTEPSTILKYGLHKQGKPARNSHWLCWAEAFELVSYFENNGEPYYLGAPSFQELYAQPDQTVTIVCTDTYKPDGGANMQCEPNKLGSFRFDGNTGDFRGTRSNAKFTFTMPDVEPGSTHTISVPAGAFYYGALDNKIVESPAAEIEIHTPAVYDGTYFLKTTIDGKQHYLSRGNDWGTRAVVDAWGQPIVITTDGSNRSLLKYADSGKWLFYSLDEGTKQQVYTDGEQARGDYRYWTVTKNGENYRITSRYMTEGAQISKHAESTNISTDGEGILLNWQLLTISEHETAMTALRNAVVADNPSALGIEVTEQTGIGYSIQVNELVEGQMTGAQVNAYPRLTEVNGSFVATAPGYYHINLQAFVSMTQGTGNVIDGFSPPAIFTFDDKQLQVCKQNASHNTFNATYPYNNDIWIRIDHEGRYDFRLELNSHTNATSQYLLKWKPTVNITRWYTEEDGIETEEDRNRKLSQLFPKGDVNYSGDIDNSDIDALINMVLGNQVTSLPAHIYSERGQADIRDLTQLYNILENRVNTQVDANDMDTENTLQAEPTTVVRYTPQIPDDPATYPTDSDVEFYMYSTSARSAWQMDLDIPKGMKILGCEVIQNGDADGHHAYYQKQSKDARDGYDTHRVVMVSPLQHSIQGKILALTLVADETYAGGPLAEGLYPIYTHNVLMDDATNSHNMTEIALSSSYVFVGTPKAQLFEAKGEVPAIVVNQLNEDTRHGITSIDLTASDIVLGGTLQPANPNTVVYTNTPQRLSSCNEVVDGVCEDLVVTERNDFGASRAFVAQKASYYRSMTGNTTWGALVLPFDIQIDPSKPYDLYRTGSADPSDPTLIVLHRLSGTVAAGTPVLVRRGANATSLQLNSVDVNVKTGDSRTIEDADGALIPSGTFVERHISEGFYVAQNQLWDAAQKTGGTTLYPFRSFYLTKPGLEASSLRFVIGDDDEEEQTTDLIIIGDILEGNATFYDLNGTQYDDLRPGMNIVRSANGSVRKILLKE